MYSHSEAETEAEGRRLGESIQSPGVIWLYGEMGAGKTAFVRGLARGLGVTGTVTSPTFAIVNEYSGRLPLFHFDLYRLTEPEELFDIGWEDYLARNGVCAVEWPERAGTPERGILVKIRPLGEGRVIDIVDLGD